MVNVPGSELTDRFNNEVAVELQRIAQLLARALDEIESLKTRVKILEP